MQSLDTRILREREVCQRTGLSRMTIRRKMKAGQFPQSVRLGENSVGWVELEVQGWINALVAERTAAGDKSKA